jgi:2-polyprenyl-3-methyl-5-hydroxy-6-metoxy-1,4-benzoquinol methylase
MNSAEIDVTAGIADKLVKCLNIVNAPYFVRYMVASRVLNAKDFRIVKSELEKCDDHKLVLNFGTTADHRRDFIRKLFKFDNNIVDIGCGEGEYAIPYSKMLSEPNVYCAFDIDQGELDKLVKKAEKKGITNIKVFNNKDALYTQMKELKKPLDIIITEVIEHMGEVDAKLFLIDILKTVADSFSTIVITTPNYEFNVHYNLDLRFRHHDHNWEMTRSQFNTFVNEVIVSAGYSLDQVKFVDIGDIVDGSPCSQGIIIRKV